MHRRPSPSDVSDEEWEFVAPYLSLLPQTAGQRRHELREVFNAVRYIVRTGAPWRWLPTNFPPWEAVYQQTRRWIAAECFEAIVQDLRLLVRPAAGRHPQPSAALVENRTLRSTVESGQRAGIDGHKRVRGSKVHTVVDSMGTLLALAVTPANEAERRQISALAQRVQEVTGETVEGLDADAASTGEETAAAAQEHGLVVVRRSWSSVRRAATAVSCCPAEGWWSAVSRGSVASGVWRATPSVFPRPGRGSISLPSSVPCSRNCSA
jgi:transposase